MKLYELLEQNEATVTTGYISRLIKRGGDIQIVEITRHSGGTFTCGLQEKLEDLGLEETTNKYLQSKKHLVVLYSDTALGFVHEFYDGLTGKPLHVSEQINEMARKRDE